MRTEPMYRVTLEGRVVRRVAFWADAVGVIADRTGKHPDHVSEQCKNGAMLDDEQREWRIVKTTPHGL